MRGWNINGISLVELLSALAVICIMACIGVPAFRSTIERQRCHAAVHMLATSLAHARNTAITRNTSVSVCPASGGSACGETVDWSNGWITYADPGHEQQPRNGNAILGAQEPTHPSISVTSSSGRLRVRFQRDGRSSGTNIRFRVCSNDRIQGDVIVNNLGRVRTLNTPGTQPCS